MSQPVREVAKMFLQQRTCVGTYDKSIHIDGVTTLTCGRNTNTYNDTIVAEIKDNMLTFYPPPFIKGSGWARALARYCNFIEVLSPVGFHCGRNLYYYRVIRKNNKYLVVNWIGYRRHREEDKVLAELKHGTQLSMLALEMGVSFAGAIVR